MLKLCDPPGDCSYIIVGSPNGEPIRALPLKLLKPPEAFNGVGGSRRSEQKWATESKCLQVLEECGFLGPHITMVNLCAIPIGLNEQETDRFLRKRGAEICYPRNAPNFGVPIAGVQRDDDPAE